jgi:DNA replication and repair protein RecF
MSLTRVTLTAVRNLQNFSIQPSPRINILFGNNGSGKTSVLEGIHLLGLARSFRSSKLQTLINHERHAFTAFGQAQIESGKRFDLGVLRNKSGDLLIRIDGKRSHCATELADILPIQLINSDSFLFLEGPQKLRRQLMDWGVFHVERRFFSSWKRFQNALQQRNALLRHGKLDKQSRIAWDLELCKAGEEVDLFRDVYIQELQLVFEKVLRELLKVDEISLGYQRGWDKERSLEDVLNASLARDQQQGFTHYGPQRADLKLMIDRHNAVDVLSRGQKKMAVCALRVAQSQLLDVRKRRECIYLIDDLPSELDQESRQLLCRSLEGLNCQVFITCVDIESLNVNWESSTKVSVFHVEHGSVDQIQGYSE